MSENWLQKTIDVGKLATGLVGRFGADTVNRICSGDDYEAARAAMAVMLSAGLTDANLTLRKQKRIGFKILNRLFDACAVIYVMGYAAARDEMIHGGKGDKDG